MKSFVGTLALASYAVAYPHLGELLKARDDQRLKARGGIVPFPTIGGIPRPAGSVPFDPKLQLVSVDGEHAWQAPGKTDQRGPCAGLNAAANHGYLPRDGIATYEAVETGLFEAFGLDQTATQVLQQTTAFFDGDPFTNTWSIGGFSPKTAVAGGLLSALGQESGICGYGHLKSEGDASITRGDFTSPEAMNSNCASYPVFFQQLLDVATEMGDGNITMAVLAAHQNNRKLHSIANNPNYFSPVFAGVAFTPAAHHFVYALMANNSVEFPQGLLTPETLMSFFSYTKDSTGALVYTYGHERIPENWYKRSPANPWTMPDIVVAVGQQCAAYPDTCGVGGNTGTVNSFAGVNVGNISGGAFDSSVYTDPAKLGCFISQNIQAEAPSFMSNVFQGATLQTALGLVTSQLVPALAAGFGACNGINVKGGNGAKGLSLATYGAKFPGAKVANSGPRANSPSP
ncbi:unspecific peroxygenase, partial [Phenoliferia sp. Uapishka_3]